MRTTRYNHSWQDKQHWMLNDSGEQIMLKQCSNCKVVKKFIDNGKNLRITYFTAEGRKIGEIAPDCYQKESFKQPNKSDDQLIDQIESILTNKEPIMVQQKKEWLVTSTAKGSQVDKFLKRQKLAEEKKKITTVAVQHPPILISNESTETKIEKRFAFAPKQLTKDGVRRLKIQHSYTDIKEYFGDEVGKINKYKVVRTCKCGVVNVMEYKDKNSKYYSNIYYLLSPTGIRYRSSPPCKSTVETMELPISNSSILATTSGKSIDTIDFEIAKAVESHDDKKLVILAKMHIYTSKVEYMNEATGSEVYKYKVERTCNCGVTNVMMFKNKGDKKHSVYYWIMPATGITKHYRSPECSLRLAAMEILLKKQNDGKVTIIEENKEDYDLPLLPENIPTEIEVADAINEYLDSKEKVTEERRPVFQFDFQDGPEILAREIIEPVTQVAATPIQIDLTELMATLQPVLDTINKKLESLKIGEYYKVKFHTRTENGDYLMNLKAIIKRCLVIMQLLYDELFDNNIRSRSVELASDFLNSVSLEFLLDYLNKEEKQLSTLMSNHKNKQNKQL